MRFQRSPALLLILLGVLSALIVGCFEATETRETDAPVGDEATARSAATAPRIDRPCEKRALAPADADVRGELRPLPAEARPVFADFLRQRNIGGDPRTVLPGVRSGPALRGVELEFPAAANEAFSIRVPLTNRRYGFVGRVLVSARLRLDDWVTFEPRLLAIESDGEGRYVQLDLDLSPFAGFTGTARLAVTAYAAPVSPTSSFRTPPIDFGAPARSAGHAPGAPALPWLEFSIGIPEVAWEAGPVTFRLEACVEQACECLHEETLDPGIEAGQRWQDRLLPISDLDGQTRTLKFTAEAKDPRPDGYVIAQWEAPRLLHEVASAAQRKPNILLVSLDTLGAGHLGSFGYTRDTSPFMSGELVRESTLFTHAIAPSTTTAPSHMTLFTSLQPSIHGVSSNLRKEGLPEGVDTLASVLSAEGYVTGSVNENGAISLALGFGRGFDYYAVFHSAAITRPEGFVGDIFDSGVRFMERHPHQPWFLFLHTYEVHYPYTPPAEYSDLFREGDDPDHPDNAILGRGRKDMYPVLYDREIRHTDNQLRRLFERLRAMGALEDTVVIVTSDHGEAFLEHDYIGHGSDVRQETVHIPLYVTGAGIPGNRRIDTPISLIDLMPTLLELVGVPAGDRFMMGQSFAPVLRGQPAQPTLTERVVVSEAWHPTGNGIRGAATIIPPTLALRRGPYKLIRYKGEDAHRYAFYDISKDPRERNDLFGATSAEASELVPIMRELEQLADAYEASSAALARKLGLPPLDTEAPDTSALDPDRLEALKALGYVE